jgi:HAD superfamily hydrolase (TIGR01549 family)
VIRAVVFDLGRVLLWFDNGLFLRALAERSGRSVEEVREIAHANLGLIRGFDSGAVTADDFRAGVCSALGLDLEAEEFWSVYADIFTVHAPGLDAARRLRSTGLKLVLLSNTDPVRYEFVRRRFPETQFFDAYILSYEVGRLKPDPGIYLEAARRAGCAPGECVFIDDLAENVAGAEAVGMKGIVYAPSTDLVAALRLLDVEL